MTELIQQARGAISVRQAADFLRDRNLSGGVFAGNGHRAALNAFIATHATVMDLTDGIFWAASPPNQLGKFVAFDVRDFSRELPERAVPPDPVLASGEFDRARQAQKFLAEAQRALQGKEAQTARHLAEQAEALNPGFFRVNNCGGVVITARPAFLAEKRELEGLLQKARSASQPVSTR